MRILLIFLVLFFQRSLVAAQIISTDTLKNQPSAHSTKKDEVRIRFGKGITFTAADSSMSIKFSVRFQSLFYAEKSLASNSKIEREMMIRRARLKFDGFVLTPKLEYKIEFGLSNRDISPVLPQGNSVSSIVYDAVLKYHTSKNTELWFGQTKLPGNRERIISSQSLQFVDRSMVNALYNLDRDAGIQFRHRFNIGKAVVRDIYAISLGEGRNITAVDTGGLSYTARLEILPFGEFTDKGDFFDADLLREQKLKLSLAAGYSYNDDAERKNGELGSFLSETRDLKTFFADVMLKYRGWSLTSEYMNKQANTSPILHDNSNFFQTGDGWNIQSGYLFKNNYEIAGRYTVVNPSVVIQKAGQANKVKEYTIGLSKYLKGHNLKIQSDFAYIKDNGEKDGALRFRLQTEMGF